MCDKVQRTVLEVLFDPDGGVFQPAPRLVGIGTVSVSGEGVIEPTPLDNDLDGGIVCPTTTSRKIPSPASSCNILPFEPKEARHKVFGRFQHSILCLDESYK